jgi:Fe-S-cluster containining protein
LGLTRSQIDARLQEIYDQVPEIPDCDRRCWISCGPADMTGRERQRIREAGYRIPPADTAALAAARRDETFWCPALTSDRLCAVYSIRPLACRIWGAVERMRCPYGCVPAGGWLPEERAWELFAEAFRAADYVVAPAWVPARAGLAEALQHPAAREFISGIWAAGREGVRLRMQDQVPPAFRHRV